MSIFNEICYIFCCPPFPSRIASKLAFLPPEASYTLIQDSNNCNLELTEDAGWQYSDIDKDRLESFFTTTRRGHQISCLFVRCSSSPKFTILYSHGNAVDLGHMSSFYLGLGSYVNCNIFSYDYSGYGASDSVPSEKNMYSDIEAAWNILRKKYHLKPEDIILYGQSIGTVATIDLASKYPVAGVILHSPMTSGMRVLCPKTTKTWFFDAFVTIQKVEEVSCPTLVIHGRQDNVIDFSHAVAIFEKCQKAVEPLWVEGAGHNDLDCACPAYLERLHFFINFELEMMAATANEFSKSHGFKSQGNASKAN